MQEANYAEIQMLKLKTSPKIRSVWNIMTNAKWRILCLFVVAIFLQRCNCAGHNFALAENLPTLTRVLLGFFQRPADPPRCQRGSHGYEKTDQKVEQDGEPAHHKSTKLRFKEKKKGMWRKMQCNGESERL